jgi:DNA polymerase-3 subunit epsilon
MGREAVPSLPPDSLDHAWKLAAVVDVETTGLDPYREEVVELAVILFAYDPAAEEIKSIVDEYVGLREPAVPIHPDAAAQHGLTPEQLRGRQLDEARVKGILERARLLLAHNSAFDRPFLERLFPACRSKPWLCTMEGIDWRAKGYRSRGLGNLLRDHGIRMEGLHRARADATATLVLLSQPSASGGTYFRELLRNAAISTGAPRRADS